MVDRSGVILLVEDNPDDIALTERAFKKARIANRLVVAKDGIEALEYFFGNSPNEKSALNDLPEVILLDLKLPKIDGLEVLRRLRNDSRTELVPVVVLTSSREERDVVTSYQLGANSYIRKPVDFKQFVKAVQELGLYWLILNEPPFQGMSWQEGSD